MIYRISAALSAVLFLTSGASSYPLAELENPQASTVLTIQYDGNGCPIDGEIRSKRSNEQAQLRLINNSGRRIAIYWLDFNGFAHFYLSMAPGDRASQQTYAGHAWFATDAYVDCWPVLTAPAGAHTHTFDP